MLGCSARGHGIILSSIVIAILLGFVGSIARVGMTAVNHRCFDTPGGGGAVLGATLVVLLLLTLIPRDGQDADDFGGGAGSGGDWAGREEGGGGLLFGFSGFGFLCLLLLFKEE